MPSNYTEYYIQLIDQRLNQPIDDDSGLYTVLTASDPTVITCYSDAAGTSLTQPATMTNGVIRFFTASTVTSVDISILTSGGRSYFLEGLTPSQHHVDVDPEQRSYQFITTWNGNTACDAVADTGFDLIAGMRIKEAFMHVTTNTTATAMDVGVSGSTAGFLSKAVTSATGFKIPEVVMTANGTAVAGVSVIVNSVQKRGLLLADWQQGIISATSLGTQVGRFNKIVYNVTAATSLVYVLKETQTGGTGEGYIYLEYDLNPTVGN